MSGTAQLLRNLINHGGADVAAASLIELYPWLDFLPPAERETFVREFVRTLQGTADVGVPSAITRFIHEWRATAAVYANPELHAILADREAVGDFGPAMAPKVTDAWQE